ncbi:pyridoxamine 5'-phosphate oxidase family protein [Saccharothrix sp. NPDC042600]|uniref:pyridoxamine 5'-phosphate oxidase family protein n=1 Tax=Saccharothrix TaxID=2071 RepID=UPI0033DF2A9A|nr:pyridoxamine 5'-phosphate oxidase family protein [Saccharothrix mutabilis subsp. capreolus]
MSVMDAAQREEFLAGVHVGVMAIARTEGPPLAVPVWYHYEPGGEVLVQTHPDAVKYRLATAAGGFSLAAQIDTPPYRYVSVSGPLTGVVEDTPWAEVDALARRYFGDGADEYLKTLEGQRIATLRMRPERWYSADYS